MEENKILLSILGIVAIVAVVGLIFAVNAGSGYSKSQNQDIVGQAAGVAKKPIRQTEITYTDPTKCHSGFFTEITGESTTVRCAEKQFVGSVINIDCRTFGDNRLILGAGWFEGTLPNQLSYSCVDRDGNVYAPSQIIAFCCDIQGVTVKTPFQKPRTAKTESGRTRMT